MNVPLTEAQEHSVSEVNKKSSCGTTQEKDCENQSGRIYTGTSSSNSYHCNIEIGSWTWCFKLDGNHDPLIELFYHTACSL
ncbi:unnamed protein product [Periconia digitata]|uniref:Uncharacterized protein n=1 Tax=Periconia digitata TaxID=1303443 RepID=A0A9W4U543_9PLEO|nr:unnamed protein product [Periconia digitata]